MNIDIQIPDEDFDSLESTIQSIEDDNEVSLSDHARLLFHLTFHAIRSDPSRVWKTEESELLEVYEEAAAKLKARFEDFVRQRRELLPASQARRITYFDALHWIGENLSGWCPVQKPKSR